MEGPGPPDLLGSYILVCELGKWLLGTIQILRKHLEWVGGVGQMLMLYAEAVHFANEVCLQGGWVSQEMVQNMLT